MTTARLTPWTMKLAVFVVPGLLGSAAFWFFIRQTLRGHVVFTHVAIITIVLYFLVGLVCLAVWLGPLLLIPYVGTWRSLRFSLVAMTAVPVLLFFPLAPWTGLALAVLIGSIWWGLESIADDMHNRLSVQPMLSLPRGITFVIFAVLVSVSLLYYQQLRGSHTTTEELSRRFIDQTVTLTERILPTVYKEYQPDMTVDDLIGQQIPTADSILKDINFNAFTNKTDQQKALEQKLKDLGIDPNAVNVDVKQGEDQVKVQIDQKLQEFRQQTIDQARLELSNRFGFPLSGRETVHEALAKIVGKQFDTYVRRWVTFIPALLALALFFVLRFFTSILQAVVVWFGWLYLRILRALKVIRITHQTVPAEKVEWGT